MAAKRSLGRPSREEAAEIENEILDAANELFCAQGFAEASMDQIAQWIGCSKITIYRRFGSKEALLMAMVDRNIARLGAIMSAAAADAPSPLRSLEQVALRFFHYSMDGKNAAFRLFIKGEAVRRPAIAERWGEWVSIAEQPLIDFVREAQASGEIASSLSAPSLATILIDLLIGVAERPTGKRDDSSDVDLDALFRIRWNAFLAVAASQPLHSGHDRE